MEPETRYAKSGGLRIAYQVIGAGPDLVMVPGLTSHLEIQWRDPGYRRFVRSDWARDLPLRLGRHGLADVDAELDVPLFRGGSAQAQFWSLTWQQVRGRAAAVGEPAHVIDLGRADLGDERRWFHGPAMVIAGGRRPPI